MPGFVSVHITAATEAEAAIIGRALVEERLAACANIVPVIRSIYRWEAKMQDENEALLIVKTTAALFTRLSARVKSLHSYSCPCIVALPVIVGDPPYLDWLQQQVATE